MVLILADDGVVGSLNGGTIVVSGTTAVSGTIVFNGLCFVWEMLLLMLLLIGRWLPWI